MSLRKFSNGSHLNIASQEAIHAAEHAFLNQFPLQADVRTECKVAIKEYKTEQSSRQRPARFVPFLSPWNASSTEREQHVRLIFYDSAGTQGSIAAKAFDHGEMVKICWRRL